MNFLSMRTLGFARSTGNSNINFLSYTVTKPRAVSANQRPMAKYELIPPSSDPLGSYLWKTKPTGVSIQCGEPNWGLQGPHGNTSVKERYWPTGARWQKECSYPLQRSTRILSLGNKTNWGNKSVESRQSNIRTLSFYY